MHKYCGTQHTFEEVEDSKQEIYSEVTEGFRVEINLPEVKGTFKVEYVDSPGKYKVGPHCWIFLLDESGEYVGMLDYHNGTVVPEMNYVDLYFKYVRLRDLTEDQYKIIEE